jgi:multisubunit Na+/H+ antiporter MnhB subunit
VVFLIVLQGLVSRPRASQVTPFYQENAKILTGAKDVVGAIIVDFRALDTLIEIAVFGIAGLAVYALLRLFAHERAKDQQQKTTSEVKPILDSHVHGIGGGETSPFIHALAYVSLPLAIIIGIIHLLYGHDQPGDGFTAGVIIGLAIAFSYVVFGPDATRRRLIWLRPIPLVAAGILLALTTGTLAAALRGSFFAHVDFGQILGLTFMRGFNLSTAFFFETAIGLTVLGSLALILDALGRPSRSIPQ